jgi:trk system potassium uptake protein TrkH
MLGALAVAESLFMAVAALIDLCYPNDGMTGFFSLGISAVITAGVGLFGYFWGKQSERQLGLRESYTLVGTVWIVFALFGMLPFLVSKTIPNVIDAFFETFSGFTTTGTTILTNIEALPHSLLLWRSLTQWLGGMGIVILSLAVMPFIGGGMQFALAESSSPTFNKIQPRIGDTARRLWAIYVALTGLQVFLLFLGGMELFDAVCHALTTMSSGGYSTKQLSISYWQSPFIHYVFIIFMIFSGINFSLLYMSFIRGKFSEMIKNDEWRNYIGLILGVTFVLTLITIVTETVISWEGVENSLRNALFQSASILSSTGFIMSNYIQWSTAAYLLLLGLMFIGGSSGSTSGGIKVVRFVIVIKNCLLEFRRLLHRNAVIPFRVNNRLMRESTVNTVYSFVTLFVLCIIIGTVALMATGIELRMAINLSLSSLANAGSTFDISSVNAAAKGIMMLMMLLGRLEIFTILLLFSPALWRK